MMRRSALRWSSGLQLASLPEVVACSTAYAGNDFATCLTSSERALEIATKYMPGSSDVVLLSAVAGRCCWRLGEFARAAPYLNGAADIDARFRSAAVRANAELYPSENITSIEEPHVAELNALLAAGGGGEIPSSLVIDLQPSESASLQWVSAGEAVASGRARLSADLAQEVLVRVLDAPSPQGPSFSGLRPRALQSLAVLHFRAQKAVSAEGLFRAAQDAWTEEPMLSPRACVYRAQGGFAYAEFLRKWEGREHHGDDEAQRACELLGGALTEEQAAWAALVLPRMQVTNLIDELWAE